MTATPAGWTSTKAACSGIPPGPSAIWQRPGSPRPTAPRQTAARSVELCRAGHGRTRAQRNAILATTCVQAGDIDQAAAIGELIIADAWDLQSRHVQGDIAALAASIGPARSRSAGSFTEQARELLAARR